MAIIVILYHLYMFSNNVALKTIKRKIIKKTL